MRWIILLFLVIALIQAFSKKSGLQKTSIWLLVAAHITLLIGLYQYFVGPVGYKLIAQNGFAAVMKDSALRFWAVEHITGMLLAIILITVARGKAKRNQYNAASWLYLVALIIILAVVPWPFRELVSRPWFPGVA